jgi:hypothetical protein
MPIAVVLFPVVVFSGVWVNLLLRLRLGFSSLFYRLYGLTPKQLLQPIHHWPPTHRVAPKENFARGLDFFPDLDDYQ